MGLKKYLRQSPSYIYLERKRFFKDHLYENLYGKVAFNRESGSRELDVG